MPTPREQLATALKQARLDAGFDSQNSLAKRLHMSRPAISKAESGSQPIPGEALLVAWARETGADLEEFIELAQRCRSSTPEWFMPYLTSEAGATRLQFWGPHVAPGLLQTANYARALEESDAVVSQRMERQQVIGRTKITAVISYRVLALAVSSPAVMAEQCGHLADLAERRLIKLHVMPEGQNVGLGGEVAIASRGTAVTVSLGTLTRDITSTAPDVVDEVLSAFDTILGVALGTVPSVEYARQMEESWKERA